MNTKLLLGIISMLTVALLVSACAPKAAETAPSAPADQPATEESAVAEPGAEKTDTTPTTTKTTTTSKPAAPSAEENTVEITADGFSPQTITVKSGEKVTWTNQHSVHAWPASAVHPTHKAYPGSDINKCNSVEREQLFDACGRLEQGESWSFTFTEKGTWKYHNHLNPGQTGTVVVE